MRGSRKSRCARQFAGDFLIGLVVFLFVLVLAALDPASARSVPVFHAKAIPAPNGMAPATVTRGTLFHTPANKAAETGLVKTEAVRTAVEITASGPVARTSVRQVFPGASAGLGRGIYAFPLPEDATVNDLLVDTGSQAIRGKLASQGEAVRILQGARNAGRKMGERTKERNLLLVELPALDLTGPVTISFTYEQVLRSENGGYRIRFPLRRDNATSKPPVSPVTPMPVSQTGDESGLAANRQRIQANDISIRILLDTGFSLESVESPTHDIAVRRTDDSTAFIHLATTPTRQDTDFELSWSAGTTDKAIAAFEEPHGKNSSIVALIRPPAEAGTGAPLPREIVFAVDTSGSMAGASLDQLKRTLIDAIGRLTPRDRFNVILFNSKPSQLFGSPEAATRESVAIATEFISRIEAVGGTDALPALEAAVKDDAKQHDTRLRQVVFITDGEISDGAAFLTRIAETRGRSRLFMVSIGTDTSEAVMERAAEVGRGSYIAIPDRSNVAHHLELFFERIEHPVVTDLRIAWPKGLRTDVWPNPFPDLYRGETLVVAGRLSGVKGELKVTGKIAGRDWSEVYALGTMKPGKGLGRFWAKKKIAALNARTSAGQSRRDVNAAIEAIALDHGLVSERSALIGIDAAAQPNGAGTLASEELAIELPAAWITDGIDRKATQQQDIDLRNDGRTDPDASNQRLTTSSISGSESAGDRPLPSRIAMYQGGTGTLAKDKDSMDQVSPDQTWILSIMAIMFGFMTALTLGLWRHLRHAVEPRRRARRNT